MIPFTCAACGKKLKVQESLAGKAVRCPGCGQRTVAAAVAAVPARGGTTASTDPATVPPQPVPPDAEAAPTVPPHEAGGAQDTQTEVRSVRPEATEFPFLAPGAGPGEIGRLGPYRILEVLGKGGMGVVFRAEDIQLRRPVALKAMLPALAGAESHRQRFVREAQTAASVEHDHVVPIFQVGEDRGVPFLAMPLLRGETLEDRLRREGALPVSEVRRIGREIAEGLQAAHERGLIHRDIKPANVWLEGARGRVKILDFGLARAVEDGAPLTQPGAVIGTPTYMAPEQLRGAAVDGRADLFSLGCVLYRMATGTPPFRGGDMLATMMAVATEEPPPPHGRNPAVPRRLSDQIMRLLAKDADGRPATARDVVAALTDPPPDAPEPPPVRRARPARRYAVPAGIAVGALALALAVLVAGATVYRIRTDRGVLVIRTSDPDVEVLVKQGGDLVTILDPKTQQQVELRSGDYDLALGGGRGGLRLSADHFTLRRGDEVIVTVTREPAPRARAGAAPGAAGELIISAAGDGQYTSLRQAVLDAPAGATLRVRPGVYQEETIVIHNRLTIVGDGPAKDVVIQTGRVSRHGLHLLAEQATLRNLTVRCARGAAVLAEHGTYLLEDCDLSTRNEDGGDWPGLLVTADATGVARRCKAHGTAHGCGVIVRSKAPARFEQCELYDNDFQGMAIDGAPEVHLERCTIRANRMNGLYFLSGGAGTVADCDLAGNHLSGVYAEKGGAPQLRDCRLTRNLEQGAWARHKASIVAAGCTAHANRMCGFLIAEKSEARLTDCDAGGNGYQGFASTFAAKTILTRCKGHDNVGFGLMLHDQGEATAEDCEFNGNARCGVESLTGALQLRGCRVHHNREEGLKVLDKGTSTARGCKFHDNDGSGVLVENLATAVLENCDAFANVNQGVQVQAGGRLTVRGGAFYRNRAGGIRLQGSLYPAAPARAEVDGCAVYENGDDGVYAAGGARLTARKCRVDDNRKSGVHFTEAAGGTVDDCDVTGNRANAFSLNGARGAAVENSRLRGSAEYGVWAEGGERCTVEGCTLAGNTKGAWHVAPGAGLERRDNREGD